MTGFADGLKSFVSSLINQRSATTQNYFDPVRLSDTDQRAIYRTGLGNKIVRIKAGYALKDTLQFASVDDEKYYQERLAKHVRAAARWMVGFGRGLVVLYRRGDDMAKPLGEVDAALLQFKVFSGDMVSPAGVSTDLQDPRYYKPEAYLVRGVPIHHSRVVDFTYVQPPELDAPKYGYGGIGEFELIYDQLVADGVVQRAAPRIIEKAATLFYKISGFKDAMRTGQEADMVQYFSRMEDIRGIHAAGIIDADDQLEVVNQSISNLADADQITLRRLAMVTGVPLALLVGESVQGLNATGDAERAMFQDMIEVVQLEYLVDSINELMALCGQGIVTFKENQGETPSVRAAFDTIAIDNAVKLAGLGEDFRAYLEQKGVIQPDDFKEMFADEAPDNN